VQAILSQFANKIEDDDASPEPVPERVRTTITRRGRVLSTAVFLSVYGRERLTTSQTQGPSDASSEDDDRDSNDEGSGDDERDSDSSEKGNNDNDALDQDEDVIHAAEAAQQIDVDEASMFVELEITVTEKQQKVASTALTKV
jgi:hypothetical protein